MTISTESQISRTHFFALNFLRPVLVQSRCSAREVTKEHAASVTQEACDCRGVRAEGEGLPDL